MTVKKKQKPGIPITPDQSRMARAAVRLGIRELAASAKLSTNTVIRFEGGGPVQQETLEKIRKTLEKAGAELIDANGGGVGVRLKKRRKRR